MKLDNLFRVVFAQFLLKPSPTSQWKDQHLQHMEPGKFICTFLWYVTARTSMILMMSLH